MNILSKGCLTGQSQLGIFFHFVIKPLNYLIDEIFRLIIMLSSRLFSRISFSSRRNFTTSIFNMAPQHRQVAVIGSGPAGNIYIPKKIKKFYLFYLKFNY